jgi:hypothetical protein
VKRLPRIAAAEPVIHGVLKIVWDDGHEGVVDLRPTIARGNVFTYLQSPENFRKVVVGEYGHGISWTDEQGREIDFDALNLRMKSDNQAKLQQVVAALNS